MLARNNGPKSVWPNAVFSVASQPDAAGRLLHPILPGPVRCLENGIDKAIFYNEVRAVLASTLPEHNRNVHEWQVLYFRKKRLAERNGR